MVPRGHSLRPGEGLGLTARQRLSIIASSRRGVELMLRGDANRSLFWWVSYVLSSAEDEIDGRDVPRAWDQTHAGKFLFGYRWADRWTLSLIGTLRTGWPTTPVIAVDDNGEPDWVPGERNSDRFESYERVDLRARRSFSISRSRISLTLDAVNLLDSENPCCLDEVLFVPGPGGSLSAVPTFDDWLGRTVSFSVLWEF